MALDDLVPDDSSPDRGGRPKESELGDTRKTSEVEGYNPFTVPKDSEEYWRDVWEDTMGDSDDDPSMDQIASMADYSMVFPWDLKVFLEKWGIWEFDWEQMPDNYPPDSFLREVLLDHGVENHFTDNVRPRQESGGITTGDEPSGGLAELVKDERDTR